MSGSVLYESILRPLLFRLDAEEAHRFACRCLPLIKLLRKREPEFPPSLETQVGKTRMENPVGLAAGFDKNAAYLDCLPSLGFGFIEVGSVTAKPSRGNPRPRLFRVKEDEAIINYMGLNGEGAEAVADRIASSGCAVPVAVNIAKTNDPGITGDAAIEDLLFSFRCVRELPLAYVAINVSCPNTHEESSELLVTLKDTLSEVSKINTKAVPLLIKLSPDLEPSHLEDILEATTALSGFIIANTTRDRSMLSVGQEALGSIPGGLSGKPLKPRMLELVRKVYERKAPEQQIIACGGIDSGADVLECLMAGASAVQIYTGLIYRGPFLAYQICDELARILETEGMILSDCIGHGAAVASP